MATVSLCLAQTAAARPTAGRLHFDIKAGPLQAALLRYAAITGDQLMYSTQVVAGGMARAVVGEYEPAEALDLLLSGTGLSARRVRAHVVVVAPALALATSATDPTSGHAPPDAPVGARAGAIAACGPAAIGRAGRGDRDDPARPDEVEPVQPDVIVTGTHIRGGNPGAPPVTTISRRDMERNGYATVAQALQALPANFGGTATEQSATAFADRSGTNASLATGVDLRGLGPGATLVLVNGQRVAGSGTTGAFADVSLIPTGAVERVEVLTDGASAIYGSDAVGGVVNILLRRAFDGAETRMRLGTVTAGGKQDVQLGETIGKQWATGGMLLAYEYDRQGALATSTRRFAASADSRPLGGTDHRYYLSLPGNILGFDPASGSFGPTFAIPPGQNGTALAPGSFLSGVTNLENFREGIDLIPRETRHSAYATLHQDVSATLHLTADARYARRSFLNRTLGGATIFDVTSANPYFVSPDGASDDLIAYGFGKELGPEHVSGYDEALAGSLGLDADLGGDWKLRSYAAFSQERSLTRTDNFENDALLAEALGSVPDDPSTPFSTAVDGYFNPYGTGASNSAAILKFIGTADIVQRIRTQDLTGHVDADGTVLGLPGGPVKLALGGDIRRETFWRGGENFYATTQPVRLVPVRGSRLIEAGFAELHVPVFGPGNARPLLHRLDLSAAVRIEHYSDFGTTTNPKVGVTWMPAGGVALRASYGTSFRAPNLKELQSPEAIYTTQLPRADGSSIAVVQLTGGNPDLRPEIASSWTAGADLHPAAIAGLAVSASWFRTIFSRRIASPASENFANALLDPTLTPFVSLVSPSTNAADLARVQALLDSPAAAGATLPATMIGAIVDSRYVNTGRVEVSGIDLTASYTLTAGANRFDLGVNGSYLLHYREQVTPLAPAIDHRNLAGYPVALRARATAGWSRGALSGQLAANFVNAYHDLEGNRVKAWTTFDLELGYAAPQQRGWAKGLEVSLAVQNLFDRAPPFYDSAVGAGYDAANASALGRFIALQTVKRL